MSFGTQLSAAIAAARTYQQITALNQEIAAAWGAHVLDDTAAGAAIEALEQRKREIADKPARQIKMPLCAPRRPSRPRSPDRAASLRRRRREIAPSNIPPQIAEHFTPGQLAALSVIARDIEHNGQCTMCVDRIAAVAGICARVVQQAQRLAEQLGFLEIEERRRPGRKSLSNVLRPSAEWASWLRLYRVNGNARHGKRMNKPLLIERADSASWRFDRPSSAPRGSAKGWSGEARPLSAALPTSPRRRVTMF